MPSLSLRALTMNRIAVLILVLAISSPAAFALTIDAKALARYDLSYVVCEAEFPEMRGHRDEAYLSLWRAKADAASRARLSAVRKAQTYRSEHALILQSRAKQVSPSASSPIKQECQVLWGQAQKFMRRRP
jgi:hypothetical protein